MLLFLYLTDLLFLFLYLGFDIVYCNFIAIFSTALYPTPKPNCADILDFSLIEYDDFSHVSYIPL